LESLTDKITPREITRALERLPKGSDALDLAYKEAIRRIQGQKPGCAELAWRVLSWITCAKRPLTSIELQHALAIEAGDSELGEDNLPDIRETVSLCAGLVVIDEEGDIIRLVHYTAQEYFEQIQTSLFPDAQDDIAVVCITYLSFNAFETGFCLTDKEFEARLRLHPLYQYAARNWGYHARAASTKVERLTLNFLGSEQKVLAAGQAMIASFPGFSQRVPGQLTGVHLAEYFELHQVISALLKNGHHPDSKDNYGQTPLSWAAENGHEAVARQLLEEGAELESRDNYGQTPLLWATRNGHEAVVKLLLERGANLESKDNCGRVLLLWAARKGHEAVVRLLLEKGADLDSKDNNSQAPLLWAARNGHEVVLKLLLEKGAEFESKDNSGRTPLSWAVENGHEVVVRLLLDKGAGFESKDNDGRTPLSWAARKGHKAVVRLLLERGAELESEDNSSRTPLSWAIRKRHKAVERLLLENGAKKPNI
jgi:ankyrin repeat protein